MGPQEIRNLQEAYLDVYAPQELDEGYMPSTQKRADKMMKQVSKLRRAASKKGDFGHPEAEAKHKQADKVYNFSRFQSDLAKKRDKAARKSEFNENIYDIILSHLLDEGYASTEESADKIILNMSESWFEQIVEDYVVVKKDGSREIVKGDPPKPEVKSGGYDYTHTEKQKEEMKKTPKTKIGSRFD